MNRRVMNEFKRSDELCERSKNDRAIIVGSEIRGLLINFKKKLVKLIPYKLHRLSVDIINLDFFLAL